MKRLITAICLCVLFAACPALGVVELKDGLPHSINYSLTDSVWVDYETPSMYTTVNVLPGAHGGDYCLMGFRDSRINMSGGYSYIPDIYSFDSSQVNISSGSISRLHIYGSSHVVISGGSITERAEIGFYSIVDISGGEVSTTIACRNASQVNISGGGFGYLYPMDNSTIRIFGSDFAVDGRPVGYGELTGWGSLTGTLLSGEPINNWFYIYDDARIILVPEPATMALLAFGGLTMLRGRRA